MFHPNILIRQTIYLFIFYFSMNQIIPSLAFNSLRWTSRCECVCESVVHLERVMWVYAKANPFCLNKICLNQGKLSRGSFSLNHGIKLLCLFILLCIYLFIYLFLNTLKSVTFDCKSNGEYGVRSLPRALTNYYC